LDLFDLNGLIPEVAHQSAKAGADVVLALNDNVVRGTCMPEVDAQVTTTFEAFEDDSVARLEQVAGELLEVVRRELLKIVR
jgi:hypothetical protein